MLPVIEEKPASCPGQERVARILVVDDDSAFLRSAWRMIEKLGFSWITAPNGMEGWKKAHSLKPDLILLDLHMPGMSGFFLLRLLRSYRPTSKIPVVCMTGQADPVGLLKEAAGGFHASGCLRKPFSMAELLTSINASLGRKDHSQPPPSAAEMGSQAGKLRYLHRGPLILDTILRRVWIGGRLVPTPTDRRFDLLCALVRGRSPMSAENLCLQLWGETFDPSTVRATARRLREDLRDYPEVRIESSREGYKLVCGPVRSPVEKQSCVTPCP